MKFTLEQIRIGLDRHAKRPFPETTLSRGQKGVITSILNEACNSDRTRYLILFWCFPGKWESADRVSSAELTDQEWYALFCWIKPQKVAKGYWRGRDELKQEIGDIFVTVMDKFKQVNFLQEVHIDNTNSHRDIGTRNTL